MEYIRRDEGALLLSASEDCTARLWTLNGQCIGMFGQKRLWNVDDPSSYRLAGSNGLEGKETEEEKGSNGRKSQLGEMGGSNADRTSPLSVSPVRRSTSPSISEQPHLSRSTPTTPRERSFLPSIEVAMAGEDGSEEDPYSWRKNEYYRSMTSLVLERSSKNSQSWSILGDHYNKDFRRRMETRQSRRDHVGNVNRKLTCGGGLGNTCSPFQALHIPDTKEYELPKNMPVSSRMTHKTNRASAEPIWMAVRQGALPPLPALKRSDSFLTMADSASGNTSQFSFLVE